MKWLWMILCWVVGMISSGLALWAAVMSGDNSTVAYFLVWGVFWLGATSTGWHVSMSIYAQAHAKAYRDAERVVAADLVKAGEPNRALRKYLRRCIANVSTANVILAKSDSDDVEPHLALVVPRRIVAEIQDLLREK